MKFELVFIPSTTISHLMVTVEMAERLIDRNEGLSITIVIISFNSKTTDMITSLSTTTSTDRLRYEVISGVNPQRTELKATDSHVQSLRPLVKDAVSKLLDPTRPDSPRLAGFVLDMYCTSMIDVADELGVPSYLFYTSNAGFLGLLLHMQVMYDKEEMSEFEDSETELAVPSLSRPYPLKCLPYIFKSKEWLPFFVTQARRFRETKGILVNSFAELEPHALKFLNNDDTRPAYPVGPLLHLKNDAGSSVEEKQTEILLWLDDQPANSVVFLCFGSMGGLSEEQAREIAVALHRSGHRFLWSLRRESLNIIKEPPGEFKNLDEVLPEGFLDRTKDRGKVIGWAPQVAVLEKPAIGGFVTHGGWNSMLESLWFGVPTAVWPLYAEQKFNAFEMVEELGLAVEIRKYWRGDLLLGRTEMEIVTAEEIERGIKSLMEQGSEVRKRVKEMSAKCHVAITEGGSSQTALNKFIQDVIDNIA